MVEGYEKFKGPNPWSVGAETLWYVGGFRWGITQKHDFSPPKAPRTGGAQPHGIWAGVYSPDAKVLRLLPKEAQDLWWTGHLPAKKMPWFIHELSPEETADTRPGSYFQEIVFGGIAALFWLMSTGAVIKTIITEGTLRNFLSETMGWVILAIAVIPSLIAALLVWSWKGKSRRLKERAHSILQGTSRSRVKGVTDGS